MKTLIKRFLALSLCVAAVAGAAYAQQKPVAIGQQAPDFTLADQNGQKRSLSAERGKRPVVLVFYRGYW